jgi:hypothetical protein
VILRANGEKVATSAVYTSAQGLAWTPSGNEVWFTSPLESGQVHALSLSGKNREVLSVPGRLFLRDISPSGMLLVTQGIVHLGMVASTGNGGPQRDLSWFDWSYLRDLSKDGRMILFEEEGAESKNFTVYVRNTEGSAAVPIGEGYGLALSPDKNWALSEKLSEPNNEIWLLPVGPGESRRMSPPGFSPLNRGAGFTADGKRVVYTGAQAGHLPRTWIQDVSGGEPRPISPENIMGYWVSPDGKWVLAAPVEETRFTLLVPINGGAPVQIANLKADDFPLGWTSDGRVYVSTFPKPGEMTGHVEKLDPHTGARTAWRDIPYSSIEGVTVLPPFITPGGNSYAFGYEQTLFDLYTMSGAMSGAR